MKKKLKRVKILQNIYHQRAQKLQADMHQAQGRVDELNAKIDELDLLRNEYHWQSEPMMKLALGQEKSLDRKKIAQENYRNIVRAHCHEETRKEHMLEGLAEKYQDKIAAQEEIRAMENLNEFSIMRQLGRKL